MPILAGAELTFVRRMLPHFLAGKSVADSAHAVLDDDARLFEAFCDRSHSYFVALGAGRSATTRWALGDEIAARITREVYETLRASHSEPSP